MSEREEPWLASVKVVEQIIETDGSVSLGVQVQSYSKYGIDRTREILGEVFGPENITRDEFRSNSSSKFAFSSEKWTSPWNPKGPEPNWRVGPPADPSLN